MIICNFCLLARKSKTSNYLIVKVLTKQKEKNIKQNNDAKFGS